MDLQVAILLKIKATYSYTESQLFLESVSVEGV